jgi:hypothetical protein
MSAMKDLIGQRFGRLTVVERAENYRTEARWRCACDCGGDTRVTGYNLRSGSVQSCGCLRREVGVENGRLSATHGHARDGKRTPEYRAWGNVIDRCTNPRAKQFPHYGGRGIKVCDRWLHGEGGKHPFECFYEDLGPRPDGHSLDRINNDGNYEPGNVRWGDGVRAGEEQASIVPSAPR